MDPVQQLQTQGYAVIRGFLADRELALLREAFGRLEARARAGGAPGAARFVVDRDPFRLHRVVWCSGADPTFVPYSSDPRFVGLASQALGSATVVQLIQQAHFKLPGDGVDFAWHQDASNRRYGTGLWDDVNGAGSFVQLALAVDAMGPHNGGLRFIPGSQHQGFVSELGTGALPKGSFDADQAVSPQLDAGDLVMFGPFVIHGSPPNLSAQPRRLFLQGYACPGANRRSYPGCGTGLVLQATEPSARAPDGCS